MRGCVIQLSSYCDEGFKTVMMRLQMWIIIQNASEIFTNAWVAWSWTELERLSESVSPWLQGEVA